MANQRGAGEGRHSCPAGPLRTYLIPPANMHRGAMASLFLPEGPEEDTHPLPPHLGCPISDLRPRRLVSRPPASGNRARDTAAAGTPVKCRVCFSAMARRMPLGLASQCSLARMSNCNPVPPPRGVVMTVWLCQEVLKANSYRQRPRPSRRAGTGRACLRLSTRRAFCSGLQTFHVV